MLKRFEFAVKKHKRNSEYQIWTHGNHAIELFFNDFTKQKLNYIHQNPVRAGIVRAAHEYMYSGACNYAGIEAVLEIDML